MDIRSFYQGLRRHGLVLFSTRDAAVLFPHQNGQVLSLQLHQWCRKGWLRRLKRGLYEIAYPEPFVLPDLYVANRLYDPSYVSLETALSYYQIVPEVAAQVTSITPKPTRRFKNTHGLFTYCTVRPAAYAGYALIRVQGQVIRVAEPEKAVVDRLYMAVRRRESVNVAEDRWDRARLKKMDRKKLISYASLFGASCKPLKEHLHAFLR